MNIKEIKASSIITKSNLPDSDFVVNPYVGCTHKCIYCYARFMKRFSNHRENRGDFLDVKVNAPDLVPAHTTKYAGKNIFFSSVTDPYLHMERKYGLTRKLLEKLIPLNPNLGIQTKSDLITRDIDLLQQFKHCEAGITITTLDDNIRKEIEPFAASVQSRIEAGRKLHEAGIKNYVFVGPIIPYFTDRKNILIQTKDFTSFYMFENLNIKGGIWNDIKMRLCAKHPEYLQKFEDIYFSPNGYWNNMEQEIKLFCSKEKIDYKVYFHHGKN